jgi:mono/diheme cytochrome c family protein
MLKARLKIIGFAVWTLLASFGVAACRQDMHDNPRFEANEDGANRQVPDGAVARGSLALAVTAPKAPVTGAAAGGNAPIAGEDGFPFKLSDDPETRKGEIKAILDRGESRFNISCLPCHGRLGDGNGMVAMRGFRHPPTYHQDRLRNAPTSHFYDVISNGFGAMPTYADQVSPEDRWKIIAYIRVLQASQMVNANQLSPEDKTKLDESERKAQAPAGSHERAPGAEAGKPGEHSVPPQTPAPASVPQASPKATSTAAPTAAPTSAPTSGGHK